MIFSVWFSPFGVRETKAVEAQLDLKVESAILIEATTGKILYKKNENVPRPPASMTKMMTEYLVLEAIKNNKLTWDTPVKTSEYAFFLAKVPDSSSAGLNLNETRTVKDLYRYMAVYSSNDATVLLAETVAGSETNFVNLMNEKAKQFGMTNSHFVTSTGFPPEELGQYRPKIEGKHYMSAKDAAILARELITTFPEALEFAKIPRTKIREGTKYEEEVENYNWMLPGLIKEYPGVDGLKTGSTDEAKYCFTGTAERDGIRLISVVMGAETKLSRFDETRKLFDYGFANYEMKKIVGKGEPVKGYEEADVKKGVSLKVPAVTEKELRIPVKKGEEEPYEIKVQYNEIIAPVKKGQPVGTLSVSYAGDAEFVSGSDKNAGTVQMVAGEDVEKAGWFRLVFRSIKNFIGSMFSGIVDSIKGAF